MVFMGVTLALALAMGRARGGRLTNIQWPPFRYGWLVILALALQFAAVAGLDGTSAAFAILALSQLLLLGFCWANRRLPGLPLVLAGLSMNAAVILLNGAMPVSAEAIRLTTTGPTRPPSGMHRLLEPGDHLALLADVIPVPPLGLVLSPGDLLLAAGAVLLLMDMMKPAQALPPGKGQNPAEAGHAEAGHAEPGHAEPGHAEPGHGEEGHAKEGPGIHADPPLPPRDRPGCRSYPETPVDRTTGWRSNPGSA